MSEFSLLPANKDSQLKSQLQTGSYIVHSTALPAEDTLLCPKMENQVTDCCADFTKRSYPTYFYYEVILSCTLLNNLVFK